jgi:tetratricopeptide (TPR) repeat protein
MFINAALGKLIDRIKEGRKFAIFLGAGSSACKPNPAILTANEIIEDLRHMFPNRNLGNNYAQVLKRAFPKQRDRRIYFEKICAARIPCLHHYQLAALIEERIFDAIYTTNFDRIVESAILHYCASHPAVYQHDSDFGGADSADKRAKLFKLHGDFLFQSLANLPMELRDKLHDDMRRKLRSHFQNHGLIVLGFGGGDKTIMSLLEEAMFDPACLKEGIYWICRGDSARPEVSRLLAAASKHQKETGLIFDTDADAFFNRLCEHLHVQLRKLPQFGIRPDKCISAIIGVPRFFPHSRQAVPRSTTKAVLSTANVNSNFKVASEIAVAIDTHGLLWLYGDIRSIKLKLSRAFEKFGRRPVFYLDCRFARNEPVARNLTDDLMHFAADYGISSSGKSVAYVFSQLKRLNAVFVLVGGTREARKEGLFDNYLEETVASLVATVKESSAGTVVLVEEKAPSPSLLASLRTAIGLKISRLRPDISFHFGCAEFVKAGNSTVVVKHGSIQPRDIGMRVLKISSPRERRTIRGNNNSKLNLEFLRILCLLRFAETAHAISVLTDVQGAKKLLSRLANAGLVEEQGGRYRLLKSACQALSGTVSHKLKLHLNVASRYERLLRTAFRGGDNDTTHYLFEAEYHYFSSQQYSRAAKLLTTADCSFNNDESFAKWWRRTLEDFLLLEGSGRRVISALRQNHRGNFLLKFEEACDKCADRPRAAAREGWLIVNRSLNKLYRALVDGERLERERQYDEAIRQYKKAAKLLQEKVPSIELGITQSKIAYCFFAKPHFDMDPTHFAQGARWDSAAAKTFAKVNAHLNRARSLDNLAFYMIQRSTTLSTRSDKEPPPNIHKDLERAQYFSHKALDLLTSISGLHNDKGVVYGNASLIYLLKGDIERAEGHFLESSLHYAAVGNLVGLCRLYFSLYKFAEDSKLFDIRSFRRIYQVAFFVWGYSRPEIMFQQMLGINLGFFNKSIENRDPVGAARTINQFGFIARDLDNKTRTEEGKRRVARFCSVFGDRAPRRYLIPQLRRNRPPWWEHHEIAQIIGAS